jgi:hypothetical protein
LSFPEFLFGYYQVIFVAAGISKELRLHQKAGNLIVFKLTAILEHYQKPRVKSKKKFTFLNMKMKKSQVNP